MDSERKKELKNSYVSRQVTGGVYQIICSGNNNVWIRSTTDLDSLKNRFNFALLTKGCPEPSMRDEWSKYGSDSFSLTVLEEIKKGDEQTSKEFSDDVKELYSIWLEKSQRQ